MSLNAWEKNGWLVEHKTSPQEIKDLLGVADRDLHDCSTKGLSDDWRLAIAYNAALQCATAALAASGFRASREAHHFRIIQSLAFTLNVDAKQVGVLDAFRKKRNTCDYERAGVASAAEANEIASIARALRKELMDWLSVNHPDLLSIK